MIQYKVKGEGSVDTYLEVTRERDDGFEVQITCVCDNYSKTVREFIDRPLFESCVRTGFLRNIGHSAVARVSA